MEAFHSRGQNDGRLSRDFEDIVYVLENRGSIWKEMNAADDNVRDYLRNEFALLQKNPYIREWIDSNSEFSSPPASFYILREIDEFIG